MGNVLVQETALQNIADQIRSDLGTDATYKPADMCSAVHSVYEKGVTDGVESAKPAVPTLEATFADNTWENIIWACQNNAVPATWKVGDKKTLTFDLQVVNVGIFAKNLNIYADGGTAPLTFFVDWTISQEPICDEDASYFGGRMESCLRGEWLSWCENENVKESIRAVSRTAKLCTTTYYPTPLEITTAEKLWLFNKDEAPRFGDGFLQTSATYWLRDQDVDTYSNIGNANYYGVMLTDLGDFYVFRQDYKCTGYCNVVFGFCF